MSDSAEDRAQLLLKETREEIVRADGKASIIFGSTLVLAGLIIGSLLSQDGWKPNELACAAEVVWWAGTALAASGVGFLGAAVYPQLCNETTEVFVSYFGHVVAHETVADLKKALERDVEANTPRTFEQLHRLSDIVNKKYHRLQAALWLEAVAVVLCVGAVVFG
jgi:hypothetical protein